MFSLGTPCKLARKLCKVASFRNCWVVVKERTFSYGIQEALLFTYTHIVAA